MFLHIGGDHLIKKEDIIGIFDLDTSTVAKTTRDFLNTAEKAGDIVYVSYELPKSFIVCKDDRKESGRTIYISQISAQTLEKRVNSKTV